MITRIVQMTFVPEHVPVFLALFEERKHRIAGAEGCMHLELHSQADAPNVFFTISRWRSENDLERYRQSELFADTWSKTKVLFESRAAAWTLEGLFDSGSVA
jgi:quinol monooxygenase YgiN